MTFWAYEWSMNERETWFLPRECLYAGASIQKQTRFLKRQITHVVVWTTTSKHNFERVLRFVDVRHTIRLCNCLGYSSNPDQYAIFLHKEAAKKQSTNKCWFDYLFEWMSTPLSSRLQRVGRRSSPNRQEWMFILMGRILFHLVWFPLCSKIESSIFTRNSETE